MCPGTIPEFPRNPADQERFRNVDFSWLPPGTDVGVRTMTLPIPHDIGPLALMGAGIALIAVAIVAALNPPTASGATTVSPAVTNRRLDAWIFFAILVFAVVLIAFGTSTSQLTGIGALVVACAGAWFRKGRSGESAPNRTDTGTIHAKFPVSSTSAPGSPTARRTWTKKPADLRGKPSHPPHVCRSRAIACNASTSAGFNTPPVLARPESSVSWSTRTSRSGVVIVMSAGPERARTGWTSAVRA